MPKLISRGIDTGDPEEIGKCPRYLAEDEKRELPCLFPKACTDSRWIDFECLNLALGKMADVGMAPLPSAGEP
jgi:hypothetical protein